MRRFANIDSDYATALMASGDPRNLGWSMAAGTLGNAVKLDEAQNDADTTEYIGDTYSSGIVGNSLWRLGANLLGPIAKQAGTNIGAGRNILDSGEGGFFGPAKTASTADSSSYATFGLPTDRTFSFTDGLSDKSYLDNLTAGSNFYSGNFGSFTPAIDYNAFTNNNVVDYGIKYNPNDSSNSLSLADAFLYDRAW